MGGGGHREESPGASEGGVLDSRGLCTPLFNFTDPFELFRSSRNEGIPFLPAFSPSILFLAFSALSAFFSAFSTFLPHFPLFCVLILKSLFFFGGGRGRPRRCGCGRASRQSPLRMSSGRTSAAWPGPGWVGSHRLPCSLAPSESPGKSGSRFGFIDMPATKQQVKSQQTRQPGTSLPQV